METRAREVRASLAQEIARRGWPASVELTGSTAAPVVELSLRAMGAPAERRWSAEVTDAPVAAQVRALLARAESVAAAAALAPADGPVRWCATG